RAADPIRRIVQGSSASQTVQKASSNRREGYRHPGYHLENKSFSPACCGAEKLPAALNLTIGYSDQENRGRGAPGGQHVWTLFVRVCGNLPDFHFRSDHRPRVAGGGARPPFLLHRVGRPKQPRAGDQHPAPAPDPLIPQQTSEKAVDHSSLATPRPALPAGLLAHSK